MLLLVLSTACLFLLFCCNWNVLIPSLISFWRLNESVSEKEETGKLPLYTFGGLFTCLTNVLALVRGDKGLFSHTEKLKRRGTDSNCRSFLYYENILPEFFAKINLQISPFMVSVQWKVFLELSIPVAQSVIVHLTDNDTILCKPTIDLHLPVHIISTNTYWWWRGLSGVYTCSEISVIDGV